MNFSTKLFYISVFAALLSVIPLAENAFSGLIMEQVRYSTDNPETKERGTIHIEDNKMKFSEESGQAAAVFDLDKGEMLQINHKEKSYVKATPEEFFKFLSEIQTKVRAQLDEQLSKLPPDQKAAVEKKLKEQGMLPPESNEPKNLTLKKTGESKEIAGYSSEKVEVYKDGKLHEEVWLSEDIKEIDMEKMSEYMRKIKEISDSLGGTDAISDKESEVYKELYESGFPMRKVEHFSESNKTVEEIVKVTESDIPASEFLPPSDYKEMTLEQIMKLSQQQ